MKEAKGSLSALDYCFTGFYPVIHTEKVPPEIFYPNYYQTYVERDVPQLIHIKNTRQFQTFIRLIVGRIGQLVNYNSLSADIGISNNTIKEWISILEASFLICILPPYYKNMKKRLVKSPKIYLTDTGLLCNLLGIENSDQVARDPLRGNIFENLVVMDILKEFHNRGIQPKIYFLRDSKGFEIDLLIEHNGIIKLIEIKSSSTWHKSFHTNLKAAEQLFEGEIELYLIYSGTEQMKLDGVQILPAGEIPKIF